LIRTYSDVTKPDNIALGVKVHDH